MGNCSYFSKLKSNTNDQESGDQLNPPSSAAAERTDGASNMEASSSNQGAGDKIEAQVFSYKELKAATKNFERKSLIGEGGFGPVYIGNLKTTGQVVAVKKHNKKSVQGDKEFEMEVQTLSRLSHPNLVQLVGSCSEKNKSLLVYEYMPKGSLADHLHGLRSNAVDLDWNTRMKIAAGAAEGLNYLHNIAKPSVIYRDLKAENILLDNEFNPKLSDLGLAKDIPEGDKSHVSTSRLMGTQGYCDPEYINTGNLTKTYDIYSFGVLLLELVTGKRAFDTTRANDKRRLVDWAQPMLTDKKNYVQLADNKINGQFSEDLLIEVVQVALRCISKDTDNRPQIDEILPFFNFLISRNKVQNRDKGDRNVGLNSKVEVAASSKGKGILSN